MEEYTENKFIRDTPLLTKYTFSAHIKRGKGITRVREQDKLIFPKICAVCGSEDIHGTIGIGRSQLYLLTNVGDVPYCKEHYRLVFAVQENYAFPILSMLGILLATGVIGALILGPDLIQALKGIMYIVCVLSFVLIRYVANRRFRRKMGMDENEEILIQPVSITYYISLFIALVVAGFGYFSNISGLYILSVLVAIYGLAADQANKRTEIDKFTETNKVLKLGAVRIVVIRPKYYSLGFVNIDFYTKFMELNREMIISSMTYDALFQTSNNP